MTLDEGDASGQHIAVKQAVRRNSFLRGTKYRSQFLSKEERSIVRSHLLVPEQNMTLETLKPKADDENT